VTILDKISKDTKIKTKNMDKLNETSNTKNDLKISAIPNETHSSNENPSDQTQYQRWKKRARGMIDERLKTESKREIWLKFFAAPIMCVIAAVVLYSILDFSIFSQLGGLMIAYFIPPLGKESIIPIGVGSGEITVPLINQHIIVQKINPLLMALSIAFVDIVTGIFLLWNYDFAKLIPFVGPWMEKVEKSGGKQFKENSWLEGLAFFGLVLFVMFPFQGSGGVGTSIVGRVIGMDKYKIVYAIFLGSVVGCLLIAYLTDLFLTFIFQNIFYGIILTIVIIIIIGIYLYKKSMRNKANG
jgi:hypothetical protein